ncbi:TonB-dependent receptor [Spirosoma sp. KCTC 42546]|uniref:TonB-dependent receptor n=1 Tax=Spirosoma sp. KCTC 42546 TaxID=2520506 RepID=UPI00115C3B21|nr:TonB-dependent receptor [Spirosoma sp. KCTC 42546]QDK82562.1 TonB-dependent receptor [Spirosoma sp. KCTC 42546]
MKKFDSALLSWSCSRRVPIFLLLMKLSVIQLFFFVTFVGLSYGFDGKAQELLNKSISLHTEGQRLRAVIGQIEKQTSVKFVYSSRNIGVDRPVTIHLNNVRLGDALDQLLKPLNLTYQLINGHIVLDSIVQDEEAKADATLPEPEVVDQVITGTISDEKGEKLPGVSIVIKGTTRGTTSDAKGQFKLSIPTGDVTLTFSFVGYKSQDVAVGNQSALTISMQPDQNSLDEVVVVGYGQVQKRDLTGSVVSIKETQITSTPVVNALETLQGKVAGMDLTRSSGETGAPLNFTIRGNRSLNASNQPLILVDGIQYGSYIDINPNDIASVEVLKDASSTAIYGSRGANGVILITTKSGKVGKTKVEFNNYYGINDPVAYQHVTNTDQYVAMTREAYRAAGQWSSPADDEKIFNIQLDNIRKGVNTDWVSLMLRSGSVQNNHIAISGGNEKTKFRLSTEYFNERGLLKYDQLRRFVQHLNLDHQVMNNLKIGMVLNFNSSTQQRRNTSFWNLQKNSPLGIPYNEDGSIKTYPFPGAVVYNPLLDESPDNYSNLTTSSRIFMLGFGEWSILKNLSLRSSFGIDISTSQQGIFEGKNTTLAGVNSGYSRAALIDVRGRNWTWENVLNYSKTIKDHSFNAMVGTSMISYRTVNFSGEGKDQPFSSSLFYNLNTNTKDIITTSSLIESSLASVFGRLNYKFKDRYLLTASLRADGASVLAEGHKWAYFPSVAVAWRLLDESFMTNTGDLFSEMKLRASYGISGNSAIGAYQTQGGLSKVAYSFDETPAFGYWPKLLANQDLGWEKTATVNIGLDFGFFKNRLTGSLDVYNTNTSDLLMDRILPSLTGYSTTVANVGKTKTRGVDLIISTRNYTSPKFSWSTDLNFATYKEEIVALSVGGDDVSKAWFVGKPLRVFYDYEKTGIWQTSEKDVAATYNKVPGEIKVRDQNNDGKITASDDRVVLGQASPKWSGGITNNFTYGNFNLSVLVYARVGQMISSQYLGYFYPGGTTAVADYWTPENPTNAYPRPWLSHTDQYLSTLGYVDGSFWKIKDIRLSYNLPKTLLKKGPLSTVTIYSTAKNFFTFSKLKDYDPERGGSVDFPLTKQLIVGLNVSF